MARKKTDIHPQNAAYDRPGNANMLNIKPLTKDAALSKIHYSKPSITELEVQYAQDAAANG